MFPAVSYGIPCLTQEHCLVHYSYFLTLQISIWILRLMIIMLYYVIWCLYIRSLCYIFNLHILKSCGVFRIPYTNVYETEEWRNQVSLFHPKSFNTRFSSSYKTRPGRRHNSFRHTIGWNCSVSLRHALPPRVKLRNLRCKVRVLKMIEWEFFLKMTVFLKNGIERVLEQKWREFEGDWEILNGEKSKRMRGQNRNRGQNRERRRWKDRQTERGQDRKMRRKKARRMKERILCFPFVFCLCWTFFFTSAAARVITHFVSPREPALLRHLDKFCHSLRWIPVYHPAPSPGPPEAPPPA